MGRDDTGQARLLAKKHHAGILRQAIKKQCDGWEKFARIGLDARRIESLMSMAVVNAEYTYDPREITLIRILMNSKNRETVRLLYESSTAPPTRLL